MARTSFIIGSSASPFLGRSPTAATDLLRRSVRSCVMTTGGKESGGGATPLTHPTPLTPPHPPISKSIELQRAMSAASRSALFSLTDEAIIFEDDYLVVVDKPPGIYCETLLSSYSGKISSHLPELHLANRLDRDTSGLMIITKSHRVAAKLVKAFTEHSVKKTYIALCTGKKPDWARTNVRSGHGRSRYGAWRVYATEDVGRVLPGGSTVREMSTSFEIIAALEEEILVKCMPETGRTHQIRLHCQYLGMPIKGDVKYGGVTAWKGEEVEFHALHAHSLEFEHPFNGLPLRFESPLPAWARGYGNME